MASKSAHWRVNSRCINCMASRTMAPGMLKEQHGRSVFVRQPETPDELTAAWRSLQLCPTVAIEAPDGLARPHELFPQDLGSEVYRLGYNAKSSFGAHSYFGIFDDVRFMIDAPRWSAHLVSWMATKGGLDHILLTHRDDVADAARYAKHFGSQVWIHQADADSAPFATEVMRGDNPAGPLPEIKVLTVPGHTRGSVMYLVNDHTLFTGDSLAWDEERQRLRAFREFCWFDWDTQVTSLNGLRERQFSRIFAGHGGSVELPPDRMKAELESLVSRARAES